MKSPSTPPSFQTILKTLRPERLLALTDQPQGNADAQYLHWDKLRRKSPPEGLTHEEWWFGLKLGRLKNARVTSLLDKHGRAFTYTLPDSVLERLHGLDSQARGQIMTEIPIANADDRDRYIVRSLMEEAITSSQLEGAPTTRKDALDLLRSGRRPRDHGERMIVNNYLAMQAIRDMDRSALAPDEIFNLHRVLTEGTLDNPHTAGRLQSPNEKRVRVMDNRDGTVLHEPPAAQELPRRLETLCRFGNSDDRASGFVHPVLRAILLHFALAYDHPFEDGNGRAARALFYWAMLRQGYWLFEYISISRLLREAPARYARAFQYTETDDNDLTYFILHQLDVIDRAIRDLHDWLARRASEMRGLEEKIAAMRDLNHRQRALLAHALRHPAHHYTIESHQRSHNVVYATARSDLYQLADQGWLTRHRVGRRMEFSHGQRLRDAELLK